MQTEVEAMYSEIEKMYKDYQTEKVLLNEEMRMKREEEMSLKNKQLKIFKRIFWTEGSLFKKRQELIKPIQDEIYRIVKEMQLKVTMQ